MSKANRVTAGRTRDFKQLAASREHHDRIALLAIHNDSTMAEQTAIALQFYFDYLDRLAASAKSKRA